MLVVHLIPQIRLGAGRIVVDLAARQVARDGSSAPLVVTSVDAEPPFRSDPGLIDELRSHGVRVEHAGDFFHRRLSGLRDAASRVRHLAEELGGPWLAHAHTAISAAVARSAGAHIVVGTCHGVALNRAEDIDLQDALAWQSCDAVTSPSRYWASELVRRFAVNDPVVLPYGVDLTTYPPRVRTPRTDSSQVRFVTVAEQTRRKGLDTLLDAMPAVWRHAPGVECHLFGDGDEAANLRVQAARVDETGRRVKFHGHQLHPYDRLGEFDVFVLPSRSDNQPIAVIEAMLSALPVLATDVGGLGELVRDGACGWVVQPDDPTVLAAALTGAVSAGESERVLLGKRGAAFARRQFDIDGAALAFEDLYRRLRAAGHP
jgi:glycosyltransferase involved in cell wall biosynthesis